MPRQCTVALVGALMLTLAGCGSDAPPPRSPLSDAVTYGSFGTVADIDCGRGKSLNVTGSNNTLKVVGACASVRVSGADNTIALERVDGRLDVDGLNNSVTYAAGDPAVEDSGPGNRIGRIIRE